MDLIHSNGRPRFGRLDPAPDKISVDQYCYRTPYGEVLKGWRKRLKYKKFKFCSIQHQALSFGVAIVDLGWMYHAFFYLYDHAEQHVEEWHANQLNFRRASVDEQPHFSQSYFYKSGYEIVMEHAHGVRQLRVSKRGEILCTARIFCASSQALDLCCPNGINGWTYTHKQTALSVEGYLMHRGQCIQFNDSSLAAIDDTCGFLRPETAWFWLSVQFTDQHNRRIGINLASGVNDSFDNENSLWVNGEIVPLSDVLFQRIEDEVWHISSLSQQLDLTVKTGWRRYENLNLRIVGSQFSQWQARVTGVIRGVVEEEIKLNEEYALLEQHYAKW